MLCTVARARYPLGLTSGITVLPEVGPSRPAVMPEVGPPEVRVMARGGEDVSVTSYKVRNKLQVQLASSMYIRVHAPPLCIRIPCKQQHRNVYNTYSM